MQSDKLAAIYREIYARQVVTILEGILSGTYTQEQGDNILRSFTQFLQSKGADLNGVIADDMLARYTQKVEGWQTVNRTALNAVLVERSRVLKAQLSGVRLSLKGDLPRIQKWATMLNDPSANIGRRTIDAIRDIGIRNIERKLITGEKFSKTEKAVFEDLHKLSEQNKIEIGEKTVYGLKVKAFEKLDNPNNYYFQLRQRNGQMAWHNVRTYSELVARTTGREASFAGVVDRGKSGKSPLIVYNLILGTDYKKIKDPCYKINGAIFSLKRNYVASNGKVYPYLFDTTGTRYLTPHPNCRHTIQNIVDTPDTLAKLDKRAEMNPYRVKAA